MPVEYHRAVQHARCAAIDCGRLQGGCGGGDRIDRSFGPIAAGHILGNFRRGSYLSPRSTESHPAGKSMARLRDVDHREQMD